MAYFLMKMTLDFLLLSRHISIFLLTRGKAHDPLWYLYPSLACCHYTYVPQTFYIVFEFKNKIRNHVQNHTRIHTYTHTHEGTDTHKQTNTICKYRVDMRYLKLIDAHTIHTHVYDAIRLNGNILNYVQIFIPLFQKARKENSFVYMYI